MHTENAMNQTWSLYNILQAEGTREIKTSSEFQLPDIPFYWYQETSCIKICC